MAEQQSQVWSARLVGRSEVAIACSRDVRPLKIESEAFPDEMAISAFSPLNSLDQID
jgi:hypothetical protein